MPTQTGSTGDDVINVSGGVDWTIDGGTGNDVIISSGTGNDTIIGGAGGDTMKGGAGNDLYDVDDPNDVVFEQFGFGTDTINAHVSYTLSSNVEVLDLSVGSGLFGVGNSLDNTIIGNGSANTLDGGTGADTMIGAAGNDIYIVDNALDVIIETSVATTEIDTVKSSLSFSLVSATNFLENLTLTGTAAINGTGNGVANVLIGNSAANNLDAGFANVLANGDGVDTLDGGGGADVMSGHDGDDTYIVDNVGDVVNEAAGEGMDTVRSSVSYTMGLFVENLRLTGTIAINGTTSANGGAITGNTAHNVLTGSAFTDLLDGGAGADRLVGGDGDDVYTVDNVNDVVVENLNEGTDEIIAFSSFTLGNNVENLTMAGTAISGTGNSLVNIIIGNASDNTLDGKVGADTMVGGAGNDTYLIDDVNDFVDEILNQGTDTVRSGITYTLTTFVENLVLTGTASIDGIGNAFGNTITGNAGNNSIDGAGGVDTMIGGGGNDTYAVDDTNDVVTELSGQGTDTVNSAISYTLGANIENLVLTGINDNDGTGNSSANTIIGNIGDNTLDGGGGVDHLIGGAGNDSYVIDASGDVIVENPGEGTDTVFSSVTYTLGAELENLTLTGTGNINGTGNAVGNTIEGNSGNNTLDGGAGVAPDTLIGHDGNDTYIVHDPLDVVIEAANEGTDTVQFASVIAGETYVLSPDVENIVLTGTADINGTGNAGDNTLTGNSGTNTLTGGDGDDTYVVDVNDRIIENPGEGNDTVLFAGAAANDTYTLSGNLENLTLTGTLAINGTGDGGDNTLTGNSAANILTGGLGNDTFIVGAGDHVVENGGEGNDTVISNVTYDLSVSAPNVENLILGGTAAVNGTGDAGANAVTGNAAKNVLTGLDGNDTLDGGAAADTMIGGNGDDLYTVDNTGDVITEASGGASGAADAVNSSVSYTLGANIEMLTLTGTANINGTGNIGANILLGNDGDNTLDGGAGVDTLTGGLGNDTYIVDSLADIVNENPGEGNDTVSSALSVDLHNYLNIENLVLTGSANVNGIGDDGDNTLTGNSGVNTMTGGLGDDTYIVGSNDTVIENAGEGTDTLIVTITSGTYIVPLNIENIILLGNGAINLSGLGGTDTLSGNNGNNTLDGGGGADMLSGGKGQDTYIVDNTGDVVVENAGEGTDSVRSSVTFTLSDNVENLTLTGAANIDGFGNGQDNTLTGNTGDNTLDGGAGTDRLVGGQGDDTYVVDTIRDTIIDAGGLHDSVISSVSLTLKAGLENLDLNGTDDFTGTGNGSANLVIGGDGNDTLKGLGGNDILYGNGELHTGLLVTPGIVADNDTLDGGTGADTMIGGLGDDVYTVDNAGDVVTENTGEGTNSLSTSVTYTLDAGSEVEVITLTGTAAISVTASDTANTITGNSGANHIFGMGGNDTLDGGLGNDILDGGTGNDLLIGGLGQNNMTGGTGADTFRFDVGSGAAGKPADVITDFNVATDNDVLDLSAILTGYDATTDTLTDFVKISNSGNINSIVQVDLDGAANGAHFVTIAILQDVTGLTGEAALVASGNLIV